jgi:hypothetical protein
MPMWKEIFHAMQGTGMTPMVMRSYCVLTVTRLVVVMSIRDNMTMGAIVICQRRQRCECPAANSTLAAASHQRGCNMRLDISIITSRVVCTMM